MQVSTKNKKLPHINTPHRQAGISAVADVVRRALLVGIGLVWGIAAVVLAGTLFAYFRSDRAYSEMLGTTSFVLDQSSEISIAPIEEALHTRAYLITGSESYLANRQLAHDKFENGIPVLQSDLAKLAPRAMPILQKLVSLHNDYDALADELIALRKSGRIEEAGTLFDQRSAPIVSAILETRHELQEAARDSALQANLEYSLSNLRIILASAAALLVVAIVGGLLLVRRVEQPLMALESYEHALVEASRSGTVSPARLPLPTDPNVASTYQAYNSLIDQMEDWKERRRQFLAMAVHELQGIASTLRNNIELLARQTPVSSTAEPEDRIRIVLQQAQSMSQLVEDVLLAARADGNQLEITFMPVRLGLLVCELIEEMRQRSGRQIALDDQLDPALVVGDPMRLRGVFWNLIDNALKYSGPETAVHVSLRRAAQPGWAECAVEDHGVGIAESEMPMLFRPFNRIQNEQTTEVPGSGLGLSLVKYVVERHHGRISVHSRPGEGATFTMWLPLQTEER